jgi:hypothetical protein
MIKSGSTPRLSFISVKFQFLARFKWLLSLVVAVLVTVAATDQQTPDEQYIQIMTLVDRGDALRAAGQMDAAKAKYRDAQRALIWFKAANPLYAPKTVTYRLNEVNARLETRLPVTVSNTPSPMAPKIEAEAAAPKVEITVTDAGTEPRKVLRFHATPGDKQSVTLTVKTAIGASAAATNAAPPAAVKIPTITIPMDVAVQNISTNGDITFTSVVGEATVTEEGETNPQMVQGMKTMLSGLKGFTVTSIVSNRGLSKKTDAKVPVDPQTKQIVELIKDVMSEPGLSLPEEAIGTSAKWEAKKAVKSQGTSTDQTATSQLTSLDGDHVKAAVSGDIKGANSKTTGLSLASTTGTVDLDLSKPVASLITMDTQIDIPVSKQQPNGGTLVMHVTLEAK